MSDTNMTNFDKRMEQILRKHARISKGYKPRVTKDGLIVAEPRRSMRLPWRFVLFVLVGVLAVKILLHATVGAAAYETQIARFAAGTGVERAAAWVMAADPFTVAVSEKIAVYLD